MEAFPVPSSHLDNKYKPTNHTENSLISKAIKDTSSDRGNGDLDCQREASRCNQPSAISNDTSACHFHDQTDSSDHTREKLSPGGRGVGARHYSHGNQTPESLRNGSTERDARAAASLHQVALSTLGDNYKEDHVQDLESPSLDDRNSNRATKNNSRVRNDGTYFTSERPEAEGGDSDGYGPCCGTDHNTYIPLKSDDYEKVRGPADDSNKVNSDIGNDLSDEKILDVKSNTNGKNSNEDIDSGVEYRTTRSQMANYSNPVDENESPSVSNWGWNNNPPCSLTWNENPHAFQNQNGTAPLERCINSGEDINYSEINTSDGENVKNRPEVPCNRHELAYPKNSLLLCAENQQFIQPSQTLSRGLVGEEKAILETSVPSNEDIPHGYKNVIKNHVELTNAAVLPSSLQARLSPGENSDTSLKDRRQQHTCCNGHDLHTAPSAQTVACHLTKPNWNSGQRIYNETTTGNKNDNSIPAADETNSIDNLLSLQSNNSDSVKTVSVAVSNPEADYRFTTTTPSVSTAKRTSSRGQLEQDLLVSAQSPSSLAARQLVDESKTSSVERLTRAGTGLHFQVKGCDNYDLATSLQRYNNNSNNNSDDDYDGDKDGKGNNLTDDIDFYSSNPINSFNKLRLVEAQPLLPVKQEADLSKRSMAQPVLQNYRKYPGALNDDVATKGYLAVNGDVHSSEFQEKSRCKSNNWINPDSNGIAVIDPDHSKMSNKNVIHPSGDKDNDEKDNDDDDDDDDEDDGGPCGWGPIRFGFCQRFRSPKWFLLVIMLCGACQGMSINGFVNTVISTIEKRFEISSTESGLIASCYDIMFVLLVIPVSYFGGHGNKPRYLGIGIFVMGVGSFVFSLPHFLTDMYDPGNPRKTICNVNQTIPATCTSGDESLSNYKYFFFLGQLLHGAGATALYTLGVVYLDENVPSRSSSLYNGIFYTGAVLGPAAGYMLGSQFLDIYTDIGVDPKSKYGLDVNNPKWVGAWWIGFLIGGVFAILLSLPLLAFPPALPGSKKYAKERGKESHHQSTVDKTGQHKGIKDILWSIKLLLTNLPFMFINIAAAADGILVAGYSTFVPKFLEYQFGLSSGKSALFVGLAAVPAGGGATFFGGFLVTFFNLKVRGILRLCSIASLLLLVFVFTLLMECDTGRFAGVTTEYLLENNKASAGFLGDDKLISPQCNSHCNCQEEDYLPMCGKDGVLYFSPCYAGCNESVDEGGTKHYYNCSCLDYNYGGVNMSNEPKYDGEFGKCNDTCKWLAPFMCLFSVMMVLMFITSMPSLTATLRCVPDHQRAFGLGIQWIVARCLGSIPGPILFGKMFDLACLLWQQRCNGSGSCYFYDNHDMRVNLMAASITFGAVAVLSFFLANWFYKVKPEDDSVEIEFKCPQESVCQSQNTLVPDTPITSETTIN